MEAVQQIPQEERVGYFKRVETRLSMETYQKLTTLCKHKQINLREAVRRIIELTLQNYPNSDM